MGFILLHDKWGDPLIISVKDILYAKVETFGPEKITIIGISRYNKEELEFRVTESVDDIYRAICRLTEDK